jgi:pimeloyl-ACP methyl ester carboxylesterase
MQTPEAEATIVLVHGAWHNAVHWAPLQARLKRLGRKTVALDLPGHGARAKLGEGYLGGDLAAFANEPSPVAGATVDQAASVVTDVLRQSQGDVRPILVGHSLGGAIISQVAEQSPDLISRLVYVAGHAPVRLKSAGAYGALPEARTGFGETLFLGDPAATGAVRINPRGAAEYLEQLREAYYNDVAYETFLPFAQALTPDLPVSFWMSEIPMSAERWGRVPKTYVRCRLDRALAPAIQSMMIAEANQLTPDNPVQVVDMDSSHSPFASQPGALARILAGLPSSEAR